MKQGPPTAVLSQRLRELLTGRRITAAVFMTFTFEPEFFEQEVLSLLAGDELNQEPRLRMVQLQEKLRGEIGPIAVYYDRAGLRPDKGARLAVRRIPVRVKTGLFHPKLVLVLTSPLDADSKERPALLCGVLSANLTRDGWWSSVECAHFEWVEEDKRCSFRDDLRSMLKAVRPLGGKEDDHEALDTINRWLKLNSAQTQHATASGVFRTRLMAGTGSFLDVLREEKQFGLAGCTLEVVSPFFDERSCTPLKELKQEFSLRETRVFLPLAADGSAICSPELYEAVRELPNTTWAHLPADFLKLGKDANARTRSVHAKVYRFVKKNERYEALVVGSHNLTTAAHQKGGNFEASFLFEPATPQLDWWLDPRTRRPSQFKPELASDEDEESPERFVPLQLTFDWVTRKAQARWDGEGRSPALHLSAGTPLFKLSALPEGKWVDVREADAAELARILESTSLVEVRRDDGATGTVLVQESGMSRKPDIIVSFTITDILEYWSRLTEEQRATYLQAHFAGNIPEEWSRSDIITRHTARQTGFFETFAGIFHGFEMLRKQVNESLSASKPSYADYLLFGAKHDSLPRLLDKAFSGEDGADGVTRYLLVLCARQLLEELRKDDREFFVSRRSDINALLDRAKNTDSLTALLALGPHGDRFLEWIEKHFLKRLEAEPVESNV